MLTKIKKFFEIFKEADNTGKPVPCVSCGACCSYFVVGFDSKYNPQVPLEKIIFHRNNKATMKGTEKFKGKCVALRGEVGKNCSCSIYVHRPDVCEAFPVWLKNGKQNPKCIKAREHHGLPGKIVV